MLSFPMQIVTLVMLLASLIIFCEIVAAIVLLRKRRGTLRGLISSMIRRSGLRKWPERNRDY